MIITDPGDGGTIARLLASVRVDAPVRQVMVGAFWTAVVLDTDPPRCGLASTLRAETHGSGPPVPDAGHLLEHSARELAGCLRSSGVLRASIGMAAFNALLEVDQAECVEINAEEVILERGSGRRVAIVGHFPFVERVRRAAAECWVLEMRLRPGDLPAGRAAEILPRADVVALTGTSLINHTFDDLIGLCRPDAYVILLGGSTPLSPVLFNCGGAAPSRREGVDVVAGTLVVDVSAAIRTLGQGATFPQIEGKRLLAMMREG